MTGDWDPDLRVPETYVTPARHHVDQAHTDWGCGLSAPRLSLPRLPWRASPGAPTRGTFPSIARQAIAFMDDMRQTTPAPTSLSIEYMPRRTEKSDGPDRGGHATRFNPACAEWPVEGGH